MKFRKIMMKFYIVLSIGFVIGWLTATVGEWLYGE